MERKFIIYKHTSPSGKVYIGQTCTATWARWRRGKGYKRCTKFWNAIQKYGWDNFEHEIIYNNLSQDEANALEEMLIAQYMKEGVAYNTKPGGNNHAGWVMDDKMKLKISKANKGKKRTDEQKLRMSISAKKRPLSEGFIKHWSEQRGKPSPMAGKHHTEKTKRRISESLKSDNNSWRGQHHSKETIQKISEGKRGELNPMFGKPNPCAGSKWMNDGKNMKRVKKDEQSKYLELGWKYGVLRTQQYMNNLVERMKTNNPNKHIRST